MLKMLKASAKAAVFEVVLITIFLIYVMANSGPGGGSGLFVVLLPIIWVVAFVRILAVLALVNLKNASRKEVITLGAIFGAISGFVVVGLLGEKSYNLFWLTLITMLSTAVAGYIFSNGKTLNESLNK